MSVAFAWQINTIRRAVRAKSSRERQFAGKTRFIDAFPSALWRSACTVTAMPPVKFAIGSFYFAGPSQTSDRADQPVIRRGELAGKNAKVRLVKCSLIWDQVAGVKYE